MNIKEKIKEIYFSDKVLKEKDYEKSRNIFIFEACTGVGIFSITSGAFLAGFAKYLGISDELNGVIGAIPALAGIVQIGSSTVFEKLKHRKLLVSCLALIHRLLLGLMFLVPILISDGKKRIIAIVIVYSISFCLGSFINPPVSDWLVNLTPGNKRGKYFSIRDGFALSFSTILTLIFGRIIDIYNGNGNEYTGFLVLAVVVFVLSLINFVSISWVKEPISSRKSFNINIKNTISLVLKNKYFKKVIMLSILWNVSLFIAGPYFSVYMVSRLDLSYSYITIIGVGATIFRILVIKSWGRLADKKSWFFTSKASIGILGLCHFLWFFSDKRTYIVLVPLLNILGGLAWAGIGISLFNIQFLYTPKEGRTAYIGVSAAIGGVTGFISTLIGGKLVNILKDISINLFGINIGNIQILFLMSGVFLMGTSLYIHYRMEKSYGLEI